MPATPGHNTKRALGAGAFAVALTIGGFAGHLVLASGDAPHRTFYACVKDGSMIPGSVVVDTAPTCHGGAELVTWNNAGPQGSAGLAGSVGPPGATGSAGSDGSTGPDGAAGASGPTGATGSPGTDGSTGAAGATGSPGATGATGAAGSGGKTIGGLVTASGSLGAGHDVTAVKLDTGTYLLRFPAGTWSSFPAIVVTPFGGSAFSVAKVDSVVAPSDGSASALVFVSSTAGTPTPADSAFLFTATAT
ncbi:MAG: hypothetical protein QOG50_881 [Actinomycetota bacterium]|nr:hypothetical protein [Actinomycetota bacterium]